MDNEKKRKKQNRTGKKKPKAQKAKAAKARKGKGGEIDYAKLIPALNNVLRRHIMRSMHASEGALSPCRLARTLGEPVSTISYHIITLRDQGAIELVAEKPVRGAIAHFYISRVAHDKTIAKLLEVTRKADEAELPTPD